MSPALPSFRSLLALLAVTVPAAGVSAADTPPAAPRVVNLYNFIRNSDDRVAHSEDVLYDATRRQVELIGGAHLPATYALQYDALINPRYQALLKDHLSPADEVAAWWELPRPLVEKAGLKWRGRHDWDPTADVGFSPGYTPDERRRLVDVYMADFKAVFGRYPRTVGSWYVDEVTLAYMADRYGIVASCNCKDQVGTDGYTLWGGYWAGAYYPSRLNAYMPAQTRAGQIDVPIFRMLGSDPVDQYGRVRGMYTLEPVYPNAGGSAAWVDWFLANLTQQPCLALAYAQAGQENSFGWPAMEKGLTLQVARLAELSKGGGVRVETLEQTGERFRAAHPLTPATAVVALDDAGHRGRRSVWYDSRFYRLNLYWDARGLIVRDLHLFNEAVPSVTHDAPLRATSLTCSTLPVMDGSLWSTKRRPAGGVLAVLSPGGASTPLPLDGPPTVRELSATDLLVTQPLHDGGRLTVTCREADVTLTAVDASGRPLRWSLDLTGGDRQLAAVQSIAADAVRYRDGGTPYVLRAASGTCQAVDHGVVRLTPDPSGVLTLVTKDD